MPLGQQRDRQEAQRLLATDDGARHLLAQASPESRAGMRIGHRPSEQCVCGGYGLVAILVQPMAIESTPLIASDDHLAHDGLIELQGGREIPCWESPERAIVIRDALLATGDYALQPPEDHGPDPIAAVHELELIDLVEHVWTDAIAAGWDASRPLVPDTFLLRAYVGVDGPGVAAGRPASAAGRVLLRHGNADRGRDGGRRSGGRRHRAHRGRSRARAARRSPTGSAGRRATMPAAT